MRTLGEITELISAQLRGDADKQIADARSLLRAEQPHITFVSDEKNLAKFLISECQAAVVSATVNLPDTSPLENFLVVENAEQAFVEVVKLFRRTRTRKRIGISEKACVSSTAKIAEDVDIYPGAYIGENVRIGCGSIIHANVAIQDNAEIGTNTVLFPGVVVYEDCIVGNRCILHGGVVIGAYGFGYRSTERHELAAQFGNVIIGDDVEIGANTTIDRGSYDSTTIGTGSKLDNLVMIGHNCQVGNHNLLCGQVGIAGSTSTGDYVVMAGQVGVGDHLNIGNKVTLAAQSGVMHDLTSGQTVLGSPAIPARRQMQVNAVSYKLPEMWKNLKKIQKRLEQLEQREQPNVRTTSVAVDEAA